MRIVVPPFGNIFISRFPVHYRRCFSKSALPCIKQTAVPRVKLSATRQFTITHYNLGRDQDSENTSIHSIIGDIQSNVSASKKLTDTVHLNNCYTQYFSLHRENIFLRLLTQDGHLRAMDYLKICIKEKELPRSGIFLHFAKELCKENQLKSVKLLHETFQRYYFPRAQILFQFSLLEAEAEWRNGDVNKAFQTLSDLYFNARDRKAVLRKLKLFLNEVELELMWDKLYEFVSFCALSFMDHAPAFVLWKFCFLNDDKSLHRRAEVLSSDLSGLVPLIRQELMDYIKISRKTNNEDLESRCHQLEELLCLIEKLKPHSELHSNIQMNIQNNQLDETIDMLLQHLEQDTRVCLYMFERTCCESALSGNIKGLLKIQSALQSKQNFPLSVDHHIIKCHWRIENYDTALDLLHKKLSDADSGAIRKVYESLLKQFAEDMMECKLRHLQKKLVSICVTCSENGYDAAAVALWRCHFTSKQLTDQLLSVSIRSSCPRTDLLLPAEICTLVETSYIAAQRPLMERIIQLITDLHREDLYSLVYGASLLQMCEDEDLPGVRRVYSKIQELDLKIQRNIKVRLDKLFARQEIEEDITQTQ